MRYVESERIELKRSTSELKEAVISIVAMLNKQGRGEVYFGICDNGKVIGLDIGRMTINHVTQAVVDNTEPKIFPKVEMRQIEGKECIVVVFHRLKWEEGKGLEGGQKGWPERVARKLLLSKRQC